MEGILDVCRRSGVPATLARTDFVPERLPFDEQFDLVFAFSVFTHISEAAHNGCLRAPAPFAQARRMPDAHRPPAQYLWFSPLMRPALEELGAGSGSPSGRGPLPVRPHPGEEHLQQDGGEMTYGETVVTAPLHPRSAGRPSSSSCATDVLLGDLYQVMLTLRRS